uniref:NADH dehydrogenase subunit 6 n=1 Tax=Xenos vesparum TaxID=31928 RepID=B7ZE96_9NEOP|nr:NADH dehydrogenase subunit 6 [Xenos vesparum]
MIKIFMALTMSLNWMFLKSNHPLSLSIILTFQTLSTAMMMSFMNKTFWYSYLLIILMMGSMIMMFIYMTSLISNMKMNMNFIYLMSIFLTPLIYENFYVNSMESQMFIKTSQNLEIYEINKIYMNNKYMILIYMLLLLFLIMMFINKLVNLKMGPIRKINDKL